MCGITCIVSRQQGIFDFLFQSLENIQNRGFDSCGIAGVNSEQEIVVIKKANDDESTSLEKLKREDTSVFDTCCIGIAHTRWATHGVSSEVNSHPHVCYRNKIALVHNGIIENYAILKKDLESKGIVFKSATDTEVIVNLISFFNETLPLMKSIKRAIKLLEGTWAIGLIHSESSMLYFTRHGSPLVMCKSDNDIVITSEVSGFYTKDKRYSSYSVVPEGKLFQMTADSHIDCEMQDINFNITDVTPYPYPHWTLKEINEQAHIDRTLNFGGRITYDDKIRLGGLDNNINRLSKCKHLFILGCGTSHHAGLVGESYFKKLCKKMNVRCMNAAEFDHETITSHFDETAVLFLSQSGETRDLIKCLEMCKKLDVTTIGVVNVVDSLIARETDCGVYCHAGREVAVASTKSFTAQSMVMVLIALWFHQQQHTDDFDVDTRKHYISQLREFAAETKSVLEKLQKISYNEIVEKLSKQSMFILGSRGKETAIAYESALKVKEICYIHCEATYSGSLKHGPLALITPNLPVVCLISNQNDWSSICNCMEEIKSRNGTTFLIGNHPTADICIPTQNEFGFMWNNIALQLIAYHISVSKRINPDMPRSLAKVVTVG